MFGWMLNFAYIALIALASPWLVYASVRKGKYRQGFTEKFLGRCPTRTGNRPCVWLHAVSVGEVKLLAPLVAEIARRRPDVQCVISTTTKTGHDLAATLYPEYTRFYCPLDFTWAVAEAMHRLRPELLVLCELELWPNLIHAARRHGAKVAVVNGRLGAKSFRGYRRIRPLVAHLLQSLDLVAAQNDEYAERFTALGARQESVEITGSLKFDGAISDRRNPRTTALQKLTRWPEDAVVLLAGSTQDPEEQLALSAFAELSVNHPKLRLIIVPRHPERFDEVARMLDASGCSWRRRTGLAKLDSASRTPLPPAPPILLVDTVGELSAWWGLTTIAFVGGSLGNRGGQNMLEPAAFGAAVSFGPNTWNFRDIVEAMLGRDAAVVIRNGEELTAFVRRCLDDPAYAEQLGRRAATMVAEGRGATGRTVELLCELLPANAAIHSRAA
ncbi:MAG: 3-deoxy-D-manno-octulosonic acid transferase [Planctomycetes bacterium]|nr:3-deoxy-D-manno-octulosonic acid transferase [Planctomycetota bacterium]